jgi:squalene-hopene/tetraprenyl-beta-curcumene cyclase
VHPFTTAPPGGWAWTDLPGGVPDGDDTPGAILALRLLANNDSFSQCREAAEAGIVWLLNLQNRDGGIPTFCRGWGALPFDRSSPDLTAHTLRAWRAWVHEVHPTIRARIRIGTERALDYLRKTQKEDGSWYPLWFGNQDREDEANPTYGTAKVLLAVAEFAKNSEKSSEDLASSATREMALRGVDWLTENQNDDGGWGGGISTPSSIEETALAIEALVTAKADRKRIDHGVAWLIEATHNGTQFPQAPVGFYFAKLWYFERLYPMIWTVSALEKYSESS